MQAKRIKLDLDIGVAIYNSIIFFSPELSFSKAFQSAALPQCHSVF